MTKDELISEAFKAMENAYAPYSNYHVGACAETTDGKLFYGANVENASYGATICAERNAVFAAYSNGYRKEQIKALAIVSDGDRIAAPCGICRQVLCELVGQTMPIYLSNGSDEMVTCIEQLLPMQFGLEDVIR
ncbi:MAG: cytidine deaminase [Solobacterium sp.]|jgi:cytidine deaminase|nr:cytidine deaminase [Solobacterium sp.]MBR3343506.1 cytidine deaminase [Solobacterium sp.]HAE16314.1 cytidine deaminase [Erysipelotrichaceae bacterium]